MWQFRLLLYDSTAVWSEGARVAPERPRAEACEVEARRRPPARAPPPPTTARPATQILLYDSNSTVWSEGGRVAPERPRAGRWVEGGHHAIAGIGQAARGRSRGQRGDIDQGASARR